MRDVDSFRVRGPPTLRSLPTLPLYRSWVHLDASSDHGSSCVSQV